MDNNSNNNSWVRPIVGGVLVGGAVTFAAPVVVAAAGFTSGGIAANSLAASMMSTLGGGATPAGGIVATLQSIGAVGAISTGASAAWAGVGAVGTWIYGRGADPANELENAGPNPPVNALENPPANALENGRPNPPVNALENPPANALENDGHNPPVNTLENPPVHAGAEPNMKDASTSTDDLNVEEIEIRPRRSISHLARESVGESVPGPSRPNDTLSAGTSTDGLSNFEAVLGPMPSVAMTSGQMTHHDQYGIRELTTIETRRRSSGDSTGRGREGVNWRIYRSNVRDIATSDTDETDDDEQEQPTVDDDSSPWIA